MAKAIGRPKGDRDDSTIRVSRVLAAKLRAVATDRGMTVAEVADELLLPAVNKAYAVMLRKLEEDGG
jgi:hypothetical protein